MLGEADHRQGRQHLRSAQHLAKRLQTRIEVTAIQTAAEIKAFYQVLRQMQATGEVCLHDLAAMR